MSIAPNSRLRLRHHGLDRVLLREVGAVVANVDAVVGGELRAQPLDLRGVAEAVQHDVGAAGGKGRGNAETDAARRAGDERGASLQHAVLPMGCDSMGPGGVRVETAYGAQDRVSRRPVGGPGRARSQG